MENAFPHLDYSSSFKFLALLDEPFSYVFTRLDRDLNKPPALTWHSTGGGYGRGVVPWGRPVAGQLSGTPLRTWLTHLTLCVPVLGSRGLSPFLSPALQLRPRGSLS